MVLRLSSIEPTAKDWPRPSCTIFKGAVIHSITLRHLEFFTDAYLGVRNDGTIAFLKAFGSIDEVRSTPGFADSVLITLQAGQFLFPGLVDTHLHAPQWPNLGLGMEGSLREWLEDWTDPLEASYGDINKARQVYADVVKTTLRLGSTTVAYNTSLHADATNVLADTCFKAGQRAIVGKMCVTQGSTNGNWEESTSKSLDESQRTIDHIYNLDTTRRLIHPSVMPRGGPYCPPELMAGLGQQSQSYHAYAQLHMCETQSDIDRTLQLHNADCYSDVYVANGLFHNRTIAAHCIYLSSKDLQNLKQYSIGVSHNPTSNTCLRDGECKVRDLIDAGIKVGLGTDCSAGYMPSIHEAMRSASNVSRHLASKANDDKYVLRFEELVFLATLGGAQVVDMATTIGNFEAGKQFDALLIDTKDVISIDPSLWSHGREGLEAMLKKWVFLGDDRSIRKVWVGGRPVSGHDMV